MLRNRLLDEINTRTTTDCLTFDVLILTDGRSLTGLYNFYGRHSVVLDVAQCMVSGQWRRISRS